MDDGFYLFSEYRDEGSEAKHYICGDYHLWVWADGVGAVRKFEFQYQDKRIRYADGEFSHGSENYIMPMFFIIDQLFGCDANVEAKLLGIRDQYVPWLHAPGQESDRGAVAAVGSMQGNYDEAPDIGQ